MKITKLVTLALTLIFIMIIPSQVVQAFDIVTTGTNTYTVEKSSQTSDTPTIIVHYIADYNGLIDDTSDYKIHEDEIIHNPNSGYFNPDTPDFYGYFLVNPCAVQIPKGSTGTYETVVWYSRIRGNDNVSHQDKNKFFKKDEVKDVGYWEQKDGKWYFVQQRVTSLVGPIAGEPAYYYGYTLNGVKISAKDGDYTKHYKTGPCWIKPDANWYHLDATGKMETGWIQDGGNWYFCWSNGQMASNTYVYGSYVNENGVWVG